MKGQVTLFVILGILIVAGAGLLIFLLSDDGEVTSEEFTSASKNRVQQFIDSCVEPATYEGLEIMRMRGGWLEIPGGVPVTVVEDNVVILESIDGPYLSDTSGFNEVPHWNVGNGPYIPTLSRMEEDLERYVEKKTVTCLDGFFSFVEEGFDVSAGDVSVEIEFDIATTVDVSLPVNVARDNEQFIVEGTQVTLPINMAKLHDYAIGLTMQELNNAYLEEHLKNLISHYGFKGVTNDEYTIPPIFMPVTGTSCNVETWNIDTTEERFKSILSETMYLLRVADTTYDDVLVSDGFDRASCAVANPSEDCVRQGALDSYIVPLFEEDMDIRIVHRYNPAWGLRSFDITPRDGNTIKPDTHEIRGVAMLSLLCYMRYTSKYTIEAPILVEVNDLWTDQTEIPVGNPDNDFTFRFFLETNLCGNQNRVCTGRPPIADDFAAAGVDVGGTPSQFCSQEHSGDLTFRVGDEVNDPLPGTSVWYRCGPISNTCYVGRTDDVGEVSGRLPYCRNGEVSTALGGYVDLYKPLTIRDNFDRYINLQTSELQNISLQVKLVHVPTFMQGWFYTDGYTQSTCAGVTADSIFASSVSELSRDTDEVFVNLLNPRGSLTPIVHFNHSTGVLEDVTLQPGTYNVDTSYVSLITIQSDVIEADDESVEVSASRDGGDVDRIFPLGEASVTWEYNGSEGVYTIYVPTNAYPEEDIVITELDGFAIQNNNFEYDIGIVPAGSSVRHNCANPQINNLPPLKVVERRWREKLAPTII